MGLCPPEPDSFRSVRVKEFGGKAGCRQLPSSPLPSQNSFTLYGIPTQSPFFPFYEVTIAQMSERRKEQLRVNGGHGIECVLEPGSPPFDSNARLAPSS